MAAMGCIGPSLNVTDSPSPTESKMDEFYITDLKVIYTDDISNLCQTENAVACYKRLIQTIICKRGDWDSCGHELCHATYDDPEHKICH